MNPLTRRNFLGLAGAGAAPDVEVDLSLPFKAARERCIMELERRYLAALLDKQGNRVSAAARVAGVDRIYFYRLLRKHGLKAREPSSE